MTSSFSHKTPYQSPNGVAIEGIVTPPSEDACTCDLFSDLEKGNPCMKRLHVVLPEPIPTPGIIKVLCQDRIL